MTRHVAAGVVGLIYICACTLLVGKLGSSHREGLRRERLALAAEAAPPPSPTLTPPPATPPTTPAPTATQPAPTPAPAPSPAPAVVNKLRPTPPTPTLPPPREIPAETVAWVKALDLDRLTPAEETRLGGELQSLVLLATPAESGGTRLERLANLARPLLEARARKDVAYRFTVLASDEVSAFSLPGGYINLCRGLFDFVGEDEDYVLEFVLAHEIAHVDLRHNVRCVQGLLRSSKQPQALSQFLFPVVAGFPDEQEYEADAWAFQQVNRLGEGSWRKSSAFLRKLRDYAEPRGFLDGRKAATEGLNPFENHLRTHPAVYERLARLEKLRTQPAAPSAPAPAPKPPPPR